MRESGSPEILAPRETDCGEDWECRAAQNSAKAMSASKFWTSDDRAPRGHRERDAKEEWVAKARNPPRVASAPPHSEGIAYKPLCGEIAMCSRVGRMGSIKRRTVARPSRHSAGLLRSLRRARKADTNQTSVGVCREQA